MLSTLIFVGAVLRSTDAQPINLDDAPPTKEPTWEPTFEYTVESTEEATVEPLSSGYVYGTEDHDSCPSDYIPITTESECRSAAAILNKGFLGSRGIGVCTYITNSRHVNDNDKFFYGPIGATENNTADHHTLICKRAECGEIERNFEYQGADFREVGDVDSAEDCARVCAEDPLCHSFSYGKKAGLPSHRICSLKSELKHTTRVLSDCCDSGLPCAADEESECVSLPKNWMDQDGDGCAAYGSGGWCGAAWQPLYTGAGGETADEACCECGGGISRRRRVEASESSEERRRVEASEAREELPAFLGQRLKAFDIAAKATN